LIEMQVADDRMIIKKDPCQGVSLDEDEFVGERIQMDKKRGCGGGASREVTPVDRVNGSILVLVWEAGP
jgi:hypothetical protein